MHHLEIIPVKIFATVANLTLMPLVIGVVLSVLLPKVSHGLRRVLAIYPKAAIFIILVLFIVPGLKTLIAALMVIARVSYPQIHILDVLLAYVLVSWLTAMVWYVLFRRQLSRSGEELL